MCPGLACRTAARSTAREPRARSVASFPLAKVCERPSPFAAGPESSASSVAKELVSLEQLEEFAAGAGALVAPAIRDWHGAWIVEQRHAEFGDVVLRDRSAGGVDVHLVDACRVEAEDLVLDLLGQCRIAKSHLHGLRDLKHAERDDLALRDAVDHTI